MRLDLYQAETAQIAKEQSSLLDEASEILLTKKTLSGLEKNGVLHALQTLIENSIGKAKQILKSKDELVPLSAYDAFSALVRVKALSEQDLVAWNAVIGLRNRIVHEYMNIDLMQVLELVRLRKYEFVVEFLLSPIDD